MLQGTNGGFTASLLIELMTHWLPLVLFLGLDRHTGSTAQLGISRLFLQYLVEELKTFEKHQYSSLFSRLKTGQHKVCELQ